MAGAAEGLFLPDHLTIVLTTSFTASCPSTSLIEAVVQSFDFVPGLSQCRLVIVCDGYRVSSAGQERRTKAGRILPVDEPPYTAYRAALQVLAGSAVGAWSRASVLELEGHHGFSWAIKAALESGLVTTSHVLIVQHDRSFMRAFDLARPLRVMLASDDLVKYLLLPTRSTTHHQKTTAWRAKVTLPIVEVGGARLLQLGFWWDSTHLASVDHYLRFVLTQKVVKRGTFPEDTLGKQMLDALKRDGLSGITPYAAYLWADELPAGSGHGRSACEVAEPECRVVGHLDGKHWRAWVDEPDADGDGEMGVQRNSRREKFRRSLAGLPGHAESASCAGECAPDGASGDSLVVGSDENEDDHNDEQKAAADDDVYVGHFVRAQAAVSSASPPLIWRPRPRRVSASLQIGWGCPLRVKLTVRFLGGEDQTLDHDVGGGGAVAARSSGAADASLDGGDTVARDEGRRAPLISVILPIHNGEAWIDGCLSALLAQTLLDPSHAHWESVLRPAERNTPNQLIELSAFDDGSSDGTWSKLEEWAPRLAAAGWRVVLSSSGMSVGSGCGNAKNRAVAVSSGEWLCFQDVDDESRPTRLAVQLAAARVHDLSMNARAELDAAHAFVDVAPSCLVGARVVRTPAGSTARYTAWANGMNAAQLRLHRFRECTLLMPTWFMHRAVFDAGDGFRVEKCEDLLFLQAHVARGGDLHRCDDVLVEYRYHAAAATHAIPRATILRHRAAALERAVLSRWDRFTIWGAGRDGRDFFKALSPAARRKVGAFCDVDAKKVGTTYQYFEHHVPIIHFSEATPPFVTCVALDRTDGAFEANLASLGLREGEDYYLFG